jgi:hypothetical protein
MTNEDLSEIKTHWSNDGFPGVEQAKSDIIRLANEVERLRESCDEITRQYARVCNQSHLQYGDHGVANSVPRISVSVR